MLREGLTVLSNASELQPTDKSVLKRRQKQEGNADFTNNLYFLRENKIKELSILNQQVQELEEVST